MLVRRLDPIVVEPKPGPPVWVDVRIVMPPVDAPAVDEDTEEAWGGRCERGRGRRRTGKRGRGKASGTELGWARTVLERWML